MSSPYPPELYAKLHVGTPGDLAHYRTACAGTRSILELGCGYGRVIETLARAGRSIVGLERDPGLLALARERVIGRVEGDIELRQGDMRQFALNRHFERILLPYSGLYCLSSDEDVIACLRCVRAHLAPRGRFLFDAYNADGFHRAGVDVPDDGEEIARIEYQGHAYHVTEQSEWDRTAQRLDVVYVHEPRHGGHSIAARIEHRYLLSEQLPRLLDAAGLRLVRLAGDFAGGPVDDDADLLVATAVASD